MALVGRRSAHHSRCLSCPRDGSVSTATTNHKRNEQVKEGLTASTFFCSVLVIEMDRVRGFGGDNANVCTAQLDVPIAQISNLILCNVNKLGITTNMDAKCPAVSETKQNRDIEQEAVNCFPERPLTELFGRWCGYRRLYKMPKHCPSTTERKRILLMYFRHFVLRSKMVVKDERSDNVNAYLTGQRSAQSFVASILSDTFMEEPLYSLSFPGLKTLAARSIRKGRARRSESRLEVCYIC